MLEPNQTIGNSLLRHDNKTVTPHLCNEFCLQIGYSNNGSVSTAAAKTWEKAWRELVQGMNLGLRR
jgi:hypothetical protein